MMTYKHEKITEIREIVGMYEVSIDGLDKTLKIKIEKLGEGKFMGVANLEVKGVKAATFYRSLNLTETKEDAFKDSLNGFRMFYSDEAEVREVSDW